MWISRKRYCAEILREYQAGLRHGIGIGRRQERMRRKRVPGLQDKSVPATTETKVVAQAANQRQDHVG